MNIDFSLRKQIALALNERFGAEITADSLSLQPTKKEFTGTYTFVTFPFLKISKMKPEETGKVIGEYLKSNSEIVEDYNVVQGFLNLHVSDMAWIKTFGRIVSIEKNGFRPSKGRRIMVEYSSPNTTKPLPL